MTTESSATGWKQRFYTFEQMLEAGARERADRVALSDPVRHARVTYRELLPAAENLSLFINGALRRGGREGRGAVSLFGENSPGWMLAFVATVLGGNVAAPLNCLTKEPEEVRRLLALAEADLVFAGRAHGARLEAALAEGWPEGLKKPAVLWLEDIDPNTGAYGGANGDEAARKPPIPANEYAILLFTSGSIASKGVMHTQASLLANQQQAAELLLVAHPNEVFVAALPLSHAYGLLCGFVPLSFGSIGAYAPTPKDLADCLAASKAAYPGMNLLAASVPELARIINQKIMLAARGGGMKGKKAAERFKARARYILFRGMRRVNYWLENCFGVDLSGVFFKAIKQKFGDELKMPIGGGPVDKKTEFGLRAVGIKAIQGYGATEMGPLIAANEPTWKTVLIGSVGCAPPGVEVALIDGEVCARGASMMLGYLDNPEATRRALPGDGWYHTGDKGHFARRSWSGKHGATDAADGVVRTRADNDWFLVLKGRVDNQFANHRGENIFPEAIETLVMDNPLICSCRVVESPASHVCAQVFPDRDAIAAKLGHEPSEQEAWRAVAQIVKQVNQKLQAGCGIDCFEVMEQDFERNAAGKFKRGATAKSA